MQYGWIKLHRKITENWLWNEKPFSKGQAWIDLLMRVNHENKKILVGNKLIDVKRGQTIWSILDMADRWGWSRKKVSSFLNTLENEGMITQKRTTKYTLITIENYDVYQYEGTAEEHQENIKRTSREKRQKGTTEYTAQTIENCGVYQDEGTTKEQQKNNKRTTKEHQKNTNKNDKNDKNDKNKKIYIQYAEFVKMTEDEYNKLVAKYGEKKVKRMIEVLDNYKGATGKKYKSDYRAILNWVADKVLKENGKDEEEDEITKEQLAYVLEQKRKKDEEAAQRAERFRKLSKEEQEKYLAMAKKIIYSNDSRRGIVWLGDYIRGEAK